MQDVPLTVKFRNTRRLEEIEQVLARKVQSLTRLYPRIKGVEVVIEVPHRHHHKGRLFRIRVAVALPGKGIVVSRQSSADRGHEQLHAAVADACATARRELQDFATQAHRRHPVVPLPQGV